MSLDHHTYPNGLNIHVDHMPGRRVSAVNVHLPYGSVHEPSGEEGFAHALEHAVFIQTDAFKNSSAIDLHGNLNGMYHNAATSYTNTTHETRGLKLGSALHHLSQVLQYATLPDKGIASEMESIRHEARKQLDDLDEMHETACDSAMFGVPYGRAAIGFHDKLYFSGDTIRDAYRTHYTLGAMTFVIVGGTSMEEVAALLPRYFDITSRQPVYTALEPVPPIPKQGIVTGLVQPQSSSLRLSVSHPIPPEIVAKIRANEELYDIAIGVINDKCFEEMRYKHELAYSSDIEIADYNHRNAWVLRGSVMVRPNSRVKAAQLLDEALAKPATSYGKRRVEGALAMGVFGAIGSLESIEARAAAHTERVDAGEVPYDLDTVDTMIEGFTVADVRAAIDDLASIAATQPRFEHRSGTRKAIGNVGKIIPRSDFI